MFDFIDKEYSFNDIPEKKKYLLERLKQIYVKVNTSELERILDSIKICFRKQDEKGASNHLKRTIYVSLNELNKYRIQTECDFLKYLNYPKSVITHETIHIFQNIFEAFPDINYTYKDNNGKRKIDYKKYVTDPGEIQSRLEQVIELLNWGFDKQEIINFLYNRRQKDKALWNNLIDNTINLLKSNCSQKNCSSKLPGIDDDENITNELNRFKENFKTKTKDKNYERNYL